MDQDKIELTDWKRILLGQTPIEFAFEVLGRTLLIYLLLLLVIRLMGKRMSGEISVAELAITIMLGAIVSVPMQVFDQGLLPAITILFTILILQRGINRVYLSLPSLERVMQGTIIELVRDGEINQAQLKRAGISHDQLLSVLRAKKVRHLGEIKRAYVEPSGSFSIFRTKERSEESPTFSLEK